MLQSTVGARGGGSSWAGATVEPFFSRHTKMERKSNQMEIVKEDSAGSDTACKECQIAK